MGERVTNVMGLGEALMHRTGCSAEDVVEFMPYALLFVGGLPLGERRAKALLARFFTRLGVCSARSRRELLDLAAAHYRECPPSPRMIRVARRLLIRRNTERRSRAVESSEISVEEAVLKSALAVAI